MLHEWFSPPGFTVPYVELWSEEEARTKQKKAASKTKYSCPGCGVNAWAKPGVALLCGGCAVALVVAAEEKSASSQGL